MSLSSYASRVAEVKRRHILDAATEVFADRGYHHATVRDVAEKAGVAAGTIYNHFKNKEELLMAILDTVNESEQREEAFADGAEDDFRRFLAHYIVHRLETIFKSSTAFRALLPELLTNARLRERYFRGIVEPTMHIARRYFAHQVEAGVLRDRSPATVTRVLAGTVIGVLMQYLLGDTDIEAEREEIASVIAEIICDGLCTAEISR